MIRGAALPFPLAGAKADTRTTLAAGYICARYLDVLGLVTPLPRYDVDIVQCGQLLQLPRLSTWVRKPPEE
jgi:hypothetical protein